MKPRGDWGGGDACSRETCSRLSDSGDDALVKSTQKYECMVWSARFIFVFALSQFRGRGYLVAWNRLRRLVYIYNIVLYSFATMPRSFIK